MVEHVAIPNVGIHEPKDVAAASSGQVYTADGLGSGSWADQAYPSNEIIVETAADFGTVVSGQVQLADDTVYRVSNTGVTTPNQLLVGSNTVIAGQCSVVSRVTYTGTLDFIVNAVNAVRVQQLAVNCPNQISTSFVVKSSLRGSVDMSDVTVPSCGSFLSHESSITILDNVGVFNFTGKFIESSGVSLSGLIMRNILSVESDASAVHIDLGTATLIDLELSNVAFIGLGTGISGLSNSGNIITGSTATVEKSTFSLVATPLSGIDPQDDQFEFSDNTGVPNSRVAGQGHIIGSALNTTFSGTGSGNAVKVNLGTAFIPDTGIQDKVTMDNTGTITYTGEANSDLYYSAEFFATVAGGASRQYVFILVKNGTTEIVSSSTKSEYDGSNPTGLSMSSVVNVDKGDTLEFFVYAATATTSLNVDTVSLKVVGI